MTTFTHTDRYIENLEKDNLKLREQLAKAEARADHFEGQMTLKESVIKQMEAAAVRRDKDMAEMARSIQLHAALQSVKI